MRAYALLIAGCAFLAGCASHILPRENQRPAPQVGSVRLDAPVYVQPAGYAVPAGDSSQALPYELSTPLREKCVLQNLPDKDAAARVMASSLSRYVTTEVRTSEPRGRNGIRIVPTVSAIRCGNELSDGTVWAPLFLFSFRSAYAPVEVELHAAAYDAATGELLAVAETVGQFEQEYSDFHGPYFITFTKSARGSTLTDALRSAADRAAAELVVHLSSRGAFR